MKNIARVLLAVVTAAGLLVSGAADAAPPPITASAAPTSVTAGTSTPVVVKATITDPNFQSANLLKTDSTGKTLATLGVLHDDGANGDAVAGDKVWSYQVAVNESLPGTVYFRVSGAFRGAALRVLSNVVAVTVDARQTQPLISVALSPPANVNGWRKSSVTAYFTCTPQGSPIATCPADQVFSTDGVDFKASGTATDQNGGSASVTSPPFSIDTTPPSIQVTLSPSGGPWFGRAVTAHFTCADGGSGIDGCPADQLFASEGTGLSATGQVVDRAGNPAAATSATFNIDLQPPTITAVLTPPPNANGWNNQPVTVHFVCADARSGIASCIGDRTVTSDGQNQAVDGSATDNAGHTTTLTAGVSIDRAPPVLNIESPVEDGVVSTTSAAMTITATDSLSDISAVTCNGVPASLVGSQAACTVALSPGRNGVTVVATDKAGNPATALRSFSYLRTPVITLLAPAALSYLNISPTTVSGTVDDPTATVTINSLPVPVVNGAFSLAVPLSEGPNVISAQAAAASGAVGTASVTVTLDTTPPHVTITSPPSEFETIDDSISVAGIVNDIVVGTVNEEQARVTVNGGVAQVANRTFLRAAVPLKIGPNVIQAAAVDRVGNAATTQITVYRKAAVLPQIHLISGNNQSGSIGTVLADPLVVSVTDVGGVPVKGKTVIFKVTQNDGLAAAGGTPSPTVVATTDSQGQAQARWTLGNRAGAGGNLLEAYAVGFDGTALFTATGTQATAGKIVIDSGNDQIGVVETPLPKPFIAVVVDTGNNRLAGVPVTFSVQTGGGHFGGQSSTTLTTDSDGRVAATLTLGLQEGNANNLVEATFPTNTGFPAAFTASGRVAGAASSTAIFGVVLDNSNTPLAGVTVRAVLTNVLHSNASSVNTAVTALTDAEGQFTIAPAPVGFVKLLIDGSTAAPNGTYPSLEYDIVTVSGQQNTVGQPIYLVALSTQNSKCVTATTGGGTLTIPEAPGFSLTFAPGQVTFPGGSKSGCVSVTVVNGDKVPMVPGFGQQPRFIVTIQPSGAVFNPPAPITLPNVDGLLPRAVTEMYSFDHDIGSFVAIGTGVVSDDGLVIRSSPSVGVLKAGWHCGGDPAASGSVADCPVCNSCKGTKCEPDNSNKPPEKCASCNNGAPVPPKTDAQCCAAITFAGGFVVCCNGSKLACAGSSFTSSTAGDAILTTCVKQHETEHYKHIDCPTGANECDTTRPNFKPGEDSNSDECDAYRVEMTCLKAASCGADVACQARVDQRITQIKGVGNGYKAGCFP